MPDISLCNELLAAEYPNLAEQARVARELGAMGLELDPSTLGPDAHALSARKIRAIREAVEGEGIRITGLHWLLSSHGDASITDPGRQGRARDILMGLIELAHGLGASVLVHGSPKQRAPMADESAAEAVARLPEFFAPVAEAARAAGLVYCIEPLSRAETDVINTVAEGAALALAVGDPAFRTMIDTSAAGQTEPPVSGLIEEWMPGSTIGHIHLDDPNRGAPGTGADPFDEILPALRRAGWSAPMTIEPFVLSGTARETFAGGIATVTDAWKEGEPR